MKKLFYVLVCGGMVMWAVGSAFSQESLGDAARRARMSKAASAGVKVYDNDTLPRSGDLGVATVRGLNTSGNETTAAPASTTAEAKNVKPAAPSAEDTQKQAAEFGSKIADQKKQIAQLERELNVLVREAQIRQTVFYADAGTMLRDQQKFADNTRKSNDQIAAKQKELDDAKQKLADLQEQARKAGVSPAERE